MIFERCGTPQYSTTLKYVSTVRYRSALFIINSTNIQLRESCFYRNVGTGFFLYQVDGHVVIEKCGFLENAVPEEERTVISGGGGISIHFTCSSSVYPECSNRYEIKDCIFRNNRATSTEVYRRIILFRLSSNNGPFEYSDEGGGVDMHLSGHSLISISNCTFSKNSANYGGGVYIHLYNYAHDTNILIYACKFTENLAVRSGGALTIAHVVQSNDTGHSVLQKQGQMGRCC